MILKSNGLIVIRSLYLFKQSISNISELIFYQPGANPLGTRPYNLFSLFAITKPLFRNISIGLLKDVLYNASSWLFWSKVLVRIYPKLRLNFAKRCISKRKTKIMHGNVSFGRYYGVLMRGYKGNSVFLVSTHSILLSYIIFISYDVLG